MSRYSALLLTLFKHDCVLSGEKWDKATIAERQRINQWIHVEREMILERLS